MLANNTKLNGRSNASDYIPLQQDLAIYRVISICCHLIGYSIKFNISKTMVAILILNIPHMNDDPLTTALCKKTYSWVFYTKLKFHDHTDAILYDQDKQVCSFSCNQCDNIIYD